MPPYTSPLSSPSLRNITHLHARTSYFPSPTSRAMHNTKPTPASVLSSPHPYPHVPPPSPVAQHAPTFSPYTAHSAHPLSPLANQPSTLGTVWKGHQSPLSPSIGSPTPGHGTGWDEALLQRHSPVVEMPSSLNPARPRTIRQSSLKNPKPMYPPYTPYPQLEFQGMVQEIELGFDHPTMVSSLYSHSNPAQGHLSMEIARPSAPVSGYPKGPITAQDIQFNPSQTFYCNGGVIPQAHAGSGSILNKTHTRAAQASERRRPSFKIELPPRPSISLGAEQGTRIDVTDSHRVTQAQCEALTHLSTDPAVVNEEGESFVILRARSRPGMATQSATKNGTGGGRGGDSVLEMVASEGRAPTVGLGYTLKMRAPTPWVRKLAEDEEWLTEGDLEDIEHGMAQIHATADQVTE